MLLAYCNESNLEASLTLKPIAWGIVVYETSIIPGPVEEIYISTGLYGNWLC